MRNAYQNVVNRAIFMVWAIPQLSKFSFKNQCFSHQTHLNYQSKTSKILIFSNTENKRENCGLIFAVNCNWPQQIYIFQYNYAYYSSTIYEKCEELSNFSGKILHFDEKSVAVVFQICCICAYIFTAFQSWIRGFLFIKVPSFLCIFLATISCEKTTIANLL